MRKTSKPTRAEGWTIIKHSPSAVIADYVECFWEMKGRMPQEHQMLFFAHCDTSFIFKLDETPYKIEFCDNKTMSTFTGAKALCQSFIPLKGSIDGSIHQFGINFKPGALSQLFNIEPHQVEDSVVDVDFLLKDHTLTEKLYLCLDFKQRIGVATEALSAIILQKTKDFRYDIVREAITRMNNQTEAYGNINRLANDLCVTHKSLTRYFQKIIGINPKVCLSMIRFRKAVVEYQRQGSIFDCYQFGYTDFSHFMKDFRKYTFHTPNELKNDIYSQRILPAMIA